MGKFSEKWALILATKKPPGPVSGEDKWSPAAIAERSGASVSTVGSLGRGATIGTLGSVERLIAAIHADHSERLELLAAWARDQLGPNERFFNIEIKHEVLREEASRVPQPPTPEQLFQQIKDPRFRREIRRLIMHEEAVDVIKAVNDLLEGKKLKKPLYSASQKK